MVTFAAKPVGSTIKNGTFNKASALKVPVKGDTPVFKAVVPVELITVFVKLAPALPDAFNYLSKAKILPFGAFKLKIISPI